MTRESAIAELPIYSTVKTPEVRKVRKHLKVDKRRFKTRYGLTLILACAFTIYTILLSSSVHYRTERIVRQEMEIEYASRLEAYKAELAEQEQAAHWLSGDASRDAAINQEVDAVAAVISKLSTDQQKATEVCCMLARVLNPSYPGSFKEVAQQRDQWMFYDGTDNTFTEHDRQIAESIIRPYMESGIIPERLTSSMVYAEWSPSDYVLRDAYNKAETKHTFTYSD